MKAGAWIPALFLAFLNAFALAEAQSPPESFSEPGTTAVQPLVPQVIIRELTFEGDLDLPVPDQDVIAAKVKGPAVQLAPEMAARSRHLDRSGMD